MDQYFRAIPSPIAPGDGTSYAPSARRWTGMLATQRGSGFGAVELFRRRPPQPPGRTGESWGDAAWAMLVGHADTVLRRYYGVFEFSDNPDCVLRLELSRSPSTVTLGDGTRVQPGEPVGVIHFWNEHLPRFPQGGPDLRWAKTVQGRMETSLAELADYTGQAPGWRAVRAFRGCAPFCSRMRAMRIRRVTGRYGFDLVEDATPGGSWHAFGENVVLWALARAFNPVATARQPFAREKHELWISRGRLMDRFGGDCSRRDRPRPTEPAC